MNPVEFQDVSFAYEASPVLSKVTVAIPPGVTSLTGPNGAGKTTFLLLASGRILPDAGTVTLVGHPTDTLDEVEKNRLCSLVYQNMEFETEDTLGDLLGFVFSNGFLPPSDKGFLKTVVTTFELDHLQNRKTQAMSKGEMQRAVMAFSLLYGSRVVVMDEPVFALEEAQKRRALGFLGDYARSAGVSFLFSAHELELTREYSDHVLLFAKDQGPRIGAPAEILSRESLEAAYQVPYVLLNKKEQLYRSALMGHTKPREALEPSS